MNDSIKIFTIYFRCFFCFCLFRVENSKCFSEMVSDFALVMLCIDFCETSRMIMMKKRRRAFDSIWFFYISRCSFLHIFKLHANCAQANSLSLSIWFYRYKRFLLLLEFSFENCAQSINCLILIACIVPFAFDECFCFCFSFHHFLSIF